jgi:D-erythro-7,8-dihydroneopterin triphosphate epimerase
LTAFVAAAGAFVMTAIGGRRRERPRFFADGSERMPDRIIINDLFLRTIIGVNDDERTNRQDVLVNLHLTVDTRAAGRSDDITDTVNYRNLTKRVIDLVEGSRYFLVEKLAEEIAQLCLEDRRVQDVTVTIEKPAALRFAKSVGISILRTRDDKRE